MEIERPIIFQPESVLGILAGRKSQTRRLRGLEDVNFYTGRLSGYFGDIPLGYRGICRSDYYIRRKDDYRKSPGQYHWFMGYRENPGELNTIIVKCPYGQVGDRLYVKEALYSRLASCGTRAFDYAHYEADGAAVCGFPEDIPGRPSRWHWRKGYLPAMFMPRWAARILVKIEEIFPVLLQDICEDEALKEGVQPGVTEKTAVDAYRQWWNSINASRGYHWDTRPWFVWRIVFRQIDC